MPPLPIQQDVVLPVEGVVRIVANAVVGGRLDLVPVDADGAHLTGHCGFEDPAVAVDDVR